MIKKINIQIWLGILIGIIIPMIILLISKIIFIFSASPITEGVISSSFLLGFGISGLLSRYFFNKKNDYLPRGILLATFIFFIYWVINFHILQ